jgi:hypothetical protein
MPAWTAEEVSTLLKMHGEGFSAARISAEMPHHSRNAICGRINRMGLSEKRPAAMTPDTRNALRRQRQAMLAKRQAANARPRPQPSPRPANPLPQVLTGLVSQPSPMPTGAPIRYGDMAPGQCRWFYEPFDDVPVMERMVCSETAEIGTSYCTHHYARVRNRPPPRQPAAGRKNFITKDPRRKSAFISEGA